MFVSGGELVLADTTPSFARTGYLSKRSANLTGYAASYAAIYKSQAWVYAVVNKISKAAARLPLKVYERQLDGSRVDVPESPYSQLLSHPNQRDNPFSFWTWTVSTLNVYGEAMWIKVRGRDGVPAELWPIHPANMAVTASDGELRYLYSPTGAAGNAQFSLPARDVVHFKFFNPDTPIRGMAPLEPLRWTLLNEDASRRATASFWENGARPSVVLSHPNTLSDEAMDRLKANWDSIHTGVDNFAKTAILEEGMEPKVLSLSAEEAQYIEGRKLNREEVCGVYDIPPPVVHILDRATFSNITEQMRSMYRDTMAPRLGELESVLDTQLRPDFDEDRTLYAEFLMDEVLRGDFEVRIETYVKAIQAGILKPAEARTKENFGPADGADRLFIQATLIPIDAVSQHTLPTEPAILPEPGDDVPGQPGALPPAPRALPAAPKGISRWVARKTTERAARVDSLTDIDVEALVGGFAADDRFDIAVMFVEAKSLNLSVPDFCSQIWAKTEEANE